MSLTPLLILTSLAHWVAPLRRWLDPGLEGQRRHREARGLAGASKAQSGVGGLKTPAFFGAVYSDCVLREQKQPQGPCDRLFQIKPSLLSIHDCVGLV